MSEGATAVDGIEQTTEQLDAELKVLTEKAEKISAEEAPEVKPTAEAKPEAAAPETQPKPKDDAAPDKQKLAAAPEAKPADAAEPAKPGDESERNRQAAAQRIKLTELERERDEWRQKAEAAAASRETAQPAQPARSTMPPEQVFSALVRANSGTFEQPGQNEQVKSAAVRVIMDEMSSRDVAAVQRAALMGQYGEASLDIADLASRYLPAVQQREREAVETQRAQSESSQRAYQDELAVATREFPAYADAKTPEGTFLKQWVSTHMGEGQTTLPKDVQAYVAKHPRLLAQMVSTAYALVQSAQKGRDSEFTKLQQENETMRKKLALKDSPERPSAPVSGDDTSGDDEIATLRRKAEEICAAAG